VALLLDSTGTLFVSNLSNSKLSANVVTAYRGTDVTPFWQVRPNGAGLALASDFLTKNLYVAGCAVSCDFGAGKPDRLLQYCLACGHNPKVIASSDTGPLLRPQSLAIDAFENLIVANGYNNDVLIYPLQAGGPPKTLDKGIQGPLQAIVTP
jgi:hypothetical protein